MTNDCKFRYYFSNRIRVHTSKRKQTETSWLFEFSLFYTPGRIVLNTTARQLEILWKFPWKEFVIKCPTNQSQ